MEYHNKKKAESYVRILGTDINEKKNLFIGLQRIKGIGAMVSNALCLILKLDKNKKIKDLTEKEIEIIETYLQEGKGDKMPSWMRNNRKSYETGKDIHLSTKDLEFAQMQVKRRLYKIKSYRGIRLREGLPVRGQRTRSHFRHNLSKRRK